MEFYQFKQNFRKNKKLYTGVAIGATSAGVVFFTYVMMRERGSSQRIDRGISVIADRGISVIADRSVVTNNVSLILSRRQGAPSWVVRCKETNVIFTSQREAARDMGLPESELSKHLNGVLDHVRGFTFERIAMAA